MVASNLSPPKDWDEKTLSKLLILRNEKVNPIKETKIFRCIDLEDLDSETGQILSWKSAQYQLSLKSKFYIGDILFGKLRPYLRKYALPNFTGICSTEIWVLTPSEFVTSGYAYYLVQSNWFIERANQTTGTKMPRADWKLLENESVLYPKNKKEQNAIANVLARIDDLIASLEMLIAKKRAVKQGAMQELLTGKKRLPGFSGKWNSMLLYEILTICHGQSKKNIEDTNGTFPILASSGEIGKTNEFIYDNPSVLIGRKGTINKPQYIACPFWPIDTLFYTIIKPTHFPKYIYYLFCTINWLSHNETSGLPSLSAHTIENISVRIPLMISEQTAIAETLSNMDNEIEQLEHKLRKYQCIKTGMMQDLLTGKIRLPQQ